MSYCVLAPKAGSKRSKVNAFRRWLLNEAGHQAAVPVLSRRTAGKRSFAAPSTRCLRVMLDFYLKEINLTQVALGKLLGVDKMTVWRWFSAEIGSGYERPITVTPNRVVSLRTRESSRPPSSTTRTASPLARP
jgi:hypothetical protein